MFDLSPAAVGILLLFIGIAFTLLTLGITRLLPRLQPTTSAPAPPASPQVTPHHEAVLIVRSGGRVVYINPAARELFNVWEDEPNLESLARRTRPSQTFLMLCAGEGLARFSLNGRFVEGTSYYTPGSITSGADLSTGHHSGILVSLRRPQLILDVHKSDGETPSSTMATDGASSSIEHAAGAYAVDVHVAGANIAEVPSQAFGIFFELTQAMAASLDLEATLQAVLESVERLFPSEFLEITLWDAEAKELIPYRLVGLAGIDRRLEKAPERYRNDQGYSGYLITHHQALLVRDVNSYRLVRPALDRQRYPFQSYIGVPLLLARDLIGTLELASLAKENYTESDLEVLRLLAGQASVAVNNALLYRKELQRSVEMAGLANLAQSASTVRDPQELYTHLIESISRLLDVEILGFLIYDENRRLLEGQTPFIGLPESILEWCQASIPADSRAEAIWKAAETILTADAPADERIQAFELHHLALAAGIHHTVLVPLTAGGRMLGYLQVANKHDGTPFDTNDLRFLAIIAGQAAPMIENLTLVQQSRRRAQRAETLRRIASLTSSAATLEEILKFSLLDLARLLQVDAAAILLVDESRGEMLLHRGSMFGIPPEVSNRLGRIPTEGPQFLHTVAGSKQPFSSGDLSQAADDTGQLLADQQNAERPEAERQLAEQQYAAQYVAALYGPLIESVNIRSVIIAPLIVREQGIGELFAGSFRPNFFNSGDAQTISTASGQIAGAIERAALYSQTDNSLRQRVDQLLALTRVSRELNTTVKLDDLLQRVYSEALRATRADCGSILLFDLDSAWAGSAPDSVQVAGDPVILFHFGDESGTKLHPLERKVLTQAGALIVEDFDPPASPTQTQGADDNLSLTKNEATEALAPAHGGIRSALVVPIAYQGQIAGLIHLHAKSPHHFGAAEREVGETLAIQAAIALGNARRFQEQQERTEELNQRVETLSKIFEVAQVLQSEQPLEQSLEAIAYAIQTATPFDRVLISIYQAEHNHLMRMVGAGIPLPELAELRAHPAPWNSIQALLDPQFSLGRSFFIPAEQGDAVPEDLLTYPVRQADDLPGPDSATDSDRWHPDDLWILPLFGTGDEPLGLISVDAPRNNLRPDRPTIEAVEIFGSQAALIIENQLKVQNLRIQVGQIEQELALAQKVAHKAQSHLPVLLHKDLEQTLAIQNLGQRARRINAGLDITEIISKKTSRSDVLQALGQETLARMDFDTVLIAETSEGGMSLAYTLGSIPGEVNPKALLGQRNPLRQCLQNGEILMVSNLNENEDWQNTAFLRALDARSFLCLPIPGVGDRDAGHNGDGRSDARQPGTTQAGKKNGKGEGESHGAAAMLAIGRNPVAPFNSQDEQLFDLLTRQITIALQNLDLLDESTRRLKEVNLLLEFSRQLGSLDPASILNTLVESALRLVPSAQTAMVALWDSRQGFLVPQASSGYVEADELASLCYRPGEGLAGQVFEQKRAANLEEVDFARHYNLSAENLLHFRNATGGRLPVSSLAAPILAGGLQSESTPASVYDSQISRARVRPLGVLVLDNAQTTSAFTENDLVLVSSLAQQTALTLENARLYQAARQRSNQLQQLTNVASTITSSLQTDDLITTLLDQLQAILPYDTGTLWLREKVNVLSSAKERGDNMVIRAANGFADSDQRIGLKVAIQDSELLNEMINTGRPIWVADVRKDLRFRALAVSEVNLNQVNPGVPGAEADDFASETGVGYEHLSWLGVPLIVTGQVIGVIALEKIEAGFYSTDDIQMATTFAGQAAIGLENSELYQESVRRAMELDQRTQTLSILNRLSYELSGSLDAARILDFAVQEYMQVMNCSSASALLLDRSRVESFSANPADRPQPDSGRVVLQAEYPYFEDDSPFYPGRVLPAAPIFERLQETQGVFNTDDIAQEPELAPLKEFLDHHQTQSLLIVPIISGSGSETDNSERHFRGMLLAHNSEPYRFSPDEVELARTICNQVAIALQNAQLLEETLSLTEDLEIRVQQRTAEVARERQRAETLLRIITELSASLDLEQVLQRTLQVLSEFVDAVQITILIARPGEKKLKRLASIGYAPAPEDPNKDTPLDIDQGLAGWIISQRQSVLIGDVMEDERWVQILYPSETWRPAFRHRSAMGVPLTSGAEALGCLLLFHPEVEHFSLDQLDLVQAAANQVAVAVNNAELYRLIRDQAEDLGNMLRTQQIETSRSKAILEAVADGVLVTDANRLITLFNESAEKILGLERESVLGKSMEHFSGLFGRATRRWMEVVETWSREPDSYQSGEMFAEQIMLENGRVISVHLSPVSLRNDFLGTVSIFQDITHQVEVDRLKSEFVATVSHELRTPMTSIKGYVEVLLMGAAGPLTEQQTRFLQVVKANTERLAVLVNDLLDISQIESGKALLAVQPVNLDDIADQAIAELKRSIEGSDKGVIIEKEIQPNLPRVLADPDRIRRVLDNLLDNAFQYNLPDGRILVRLSQVGDEVQVDVKDNGVGIHPDDQERVFERFFRGESTLTLGVAGTGLGLSIVQNLVRMQNGRIWLESTGIPGQGSTFSFTLPVYIPGDI